MKIFFASVAFTFALMLSVGTSVALEWQPGPPLPYPVMNAPAVVVGDAVFILGGMSGGTGSENVVDSIITARIQPDGSLTPFRVARTRLPEPRAGMGAGVVGGAIYVYGGYTRNNLAISPACWRLPVGEDGTLQQPVITSVTLPAADRIQLAAGFGRTDLAVNGRLYIVGGEGQSQDQTFVNLTHAYLNAPENGSFGAQWTQLVPENPVVNSANNARGVLHPAVAAYRGDTLTYIYQIGGALYPNSGRFEPDSATSRVAIATLNPDTGQFVTWSAGADLPVRKMGAIALSHVNLIHVIGGSSNEFPTDQSVYTGTVDPYSGTVEWERDNGVFPFEARAPAGVTYTTPDGSAWAAVFGGHESAHAQTAVARIGPPTNPDLSPPPTTPEPTPESENTPRPSLALAQKARYPDIPVAGFHPPAAARSLIAGPPPRPHILYFTASAAIMSQEQNALLQDPAFAPIADKAVCVWIDMRDNPALARQLKVFKVPTWIFYNSDGTEELRAVDMITIDQIDTFVNRLN